MSEIIAQAGIHDHMPIQFRVSDFLRWSDGVRSVSVETIATLGAGRQNVFLRHVNEEVAIAYVEMKRTEAEALGLNLELDGPRIRISRKDGEGLTHADLKIFNQFSTSGFEPLSS